MNTKPIRDPERKTGPVKNILLIMADDLKASVLPAYGGEVCKTPSIDRLAASGMAFNGSYCQGLACAPSRPSMMRSIYPRSKATAPTIGEHLQSHGMHTARVGKIFHMPVPHAQLDGSAGKDVPESGPSVTTRSRPRPSRRDSTGCSTRIS